jgi:hypothetical protein
MAAGTGSLVEGFTTHVNHHSGMQLKEGTAGSIPIPFTDRFSGLFFLVLLVCHCPHNV